MINLVNISKCIGDFTLNNINLRIEDNEYFVILGPTGAGKTVVLEIISGMYKPDEGEVWINEHNVTSEYPEERHIGFVYQDYMLFPHLNVQENIIFALKIKKTPQNIINKKLEQMANLLNIEKIPLNAERWRTAKSSYCSSTSCRTCSFAVGRTVKCFGSTK